jgi:hypothetical protein
MLAEVRGMGKNTKQEDQKRVHYRGDKKLVGEKGLQRGRGRCPQAGKTKLRNTTKSKDEGVFRGGHQMIQRVLARPRHQGQGSPHPAQPSRDLLTGHLLVWLLAPSHVSDLKWPLMRSLP